MPACPICAYARQMDRVARAIVLLTSVRVQGWDRATARPVEEEVLRIARDASAECEGDLELAAKLLRERRLASVNREFEALLESGGHDREACDG